MYWKDENSYKGMKQAVSGCSSLFGVKEKSHQSQDCRFIPSRRGTNNSYNQYLLKENINSCNIIPTDDHISSGQASFVSQSSTQIGQGISSQSSQHPTTSDQDTTSALQTNLNSHSTYQQLVQECLFGNSNPQHAMHNMNNPASLNEGDSQFAHSKKQRVLQFHSHNESNTSFDSSGHFDKCLSKSFFRGDSSRINTGNSSFIKSRVISHLPERILDAPAISDDYYLNLLDWGDCGGHSGSTTKSHNGVLAVSLSNEVYLWSEENIVSLMQCPENEYVSSVSWMKSSRKNCLAVGVSDGTVQLWDGEKGLAYRVLRGHSSRVSALSWNGGMLSSGGRDTQILHHDIRVKNSVVVKFEGHEQEVCGLKWSPDGSQLASGSNDNSLRIWDMSLHNSNNQQADSNNSIGQGNVLGVFRQHRAAVKALAWCPWQRNLLASGGGTQDKTIKFWNTDKMQLTSSISCGSQVSALLWNPHSKELLSSHGFQDNQLTLWSYPTMRKITELTGHTNRVLHMALSPDATTVCSASSDETLRFWKIFAGDPSRTDFHPDDDEDENYAAPFSKLKKDGGAFSSSLFLR